MIAFVPSFVPFFLDSFFLPLFSLYLFFFSSLASFFPPFAFLPSLLSSFILFFISSLAYFNPYFLSSLLTYILRTFFLSLHSFFFLYSIIFFFDSLLCYRSYIPSFLPSFFFQSFLLCFLSIISYFYSHDFLPCSAFRTPSFLTAPPSSSYSVIPLPLSSLLLFLFSRLHFV